ncbi:MAG: hypothetical protein JWN51_466 [Phycisphaerales bacterium]|nr:hypothetical protein [Phycisphaerales bacterium]
MSPDVVTNGEPGCRYHLDRGTPELPELLC